jgi:hypothetical protein
MDHNDNNKAWFEKNFRYLRDTIAPIGENDSTSQRRIKNFGFGMFITVLICGTLAVLIAASFAH